MKIKKEFFLLFICLIFFFACVNETTESKVITPKPVSYIVLEKSAVFNQKNMAFSIDSINNRLLIHLTINELSKAFPFPINKKYKDTLTRTVFNFDFYSGGKPLLSDYNSLQNTLLWKQEVGTCHLKLLSDSVDIKYRTDIYFEVPYYAFHKLKKGKRSIELRIWQEVFSDRVDIKKANGAYKTSYLSAIKRLFDAKVKFDIEIPPIYLSTIYGQGLVLKNDSTFSPAGMDNTIWKSSYPDIYWAVVYPKRTLYAQTAYETSTAQYTGLDTFTLYHYYSNDSVGFDVYDHDNLSRDDLLGCWWGSLKDVSGKVCSDITFGNVKSFKAIVKGQGVINK